MTKRANDFLIWRAGTSVGWDCTAADLAREVGMDPSGVKRTCREKGWSIQGEFQRKGYANRSSIDTLMKSPSFAGRAET